MSPNEALWSMGYGMLPLVIGSTPTLYPDPVPPAAGFPVRRAAVSLFVALTATHRRVLCGVINPV
jgi:hypothetical protein